MKKYILIGLFAFFGCASKNDPVVIAKNETKAVSPQPNKNDVNFLIEMADARMMDSKEGELAAERGTTAQLRSYGQLMVTDQALLLEQIRALAASENITLPTAISESKAAGLEGLKKKTGKGFDHKFISMITKDHKRDIKQFKKATGENFSPMVREFAGARLPLIQSHLDKITAIKDQQ